MVSHKQKCLCVANLWASPIFIQVDFYKQVSRHKKLCFTQMNNSIKPATSQSQGCWIPTCFTLMISWLHNQGMNETLTMCLEHWRENQLPVWTWSTVAQTHTTADGCLMRVRKALYYPTLWWKEACFQIYNQLPAFLVFATTWLCVQNLEHKWPVYIIQDLSNHKLIHHFWGACAWVVSVALYTYVILHTI